jgi:Fe-S oxidoreductase
MARMKIEFMHQYRKQHAPRLRERLVAWLPRYAPFAARLPWLFNLRDRIPGLAWLSEPLLGLSAHRELPQWRRDFFGSRLGDRPSAEGTAGEVVLWVDTFNTWFEPENARAALAVLQAAGCRVHLARPRDGGRPLCCGRTFLTAGFAAQAQEEAQRLIEVLGPYAMRGLPIVGLEPSCLLSLRDELVGLIRGEATRAIAGQALLLEEFLAREHAAGRLKLALKRFPGQPVLLHGHCHQKAFGVMSAVQQTLALVPGLEVKQIESSCCGMAGAFGYEAEHQEVSMRMGEMNLLPAVREAPAQTWLVADGTSCRAQIRDGAGRDAMHVARVLAAALTAAAQ